MNDTNMNVLGAYFLGAVYLLGLTAAGLAWHMPVVVLLALASAGVGYICQVFGAFSLTTGAIVCWLLSAATGLAGGIALVLGLA